MRTLAACFAILILLAPTRAFAREAPSEDEETEEESELDNAEFGPRGNLRTRAETVSFDARQRMLELSGNVRIDSPPFHLRSQHLTLTRTPYGIEVEGKGRLAFCPCLGTPLTVEFDKAIAAPPGDFLLKNPTLEFYGVPVMHLPWFWLRSDEKAGVLPPDIAYRGQDGFFVGGGAHLPWRNSGQKYAIDLRGGGYLFRGFAADVRLRTPVSTMKIRYDRLPGGTAPVLPVPSSSADHEGDDGLLLDARGGQTRDGLTTAWDVDILRGRRGVAATTDLDAAAKPWDRGAVDGALRAGPFVASSGVRSVTRRGGGLIDVEAIGPVTALRASGAITSGIVYDATVEGGALRVSGTAASLAAIQPPAITPDTLSFARAELGALAATSLGAAAVSLSARGAADVAAEGRRDGSDHAGTARARLGVPLVRAFESSSADPYERNDPLIHVVEPFAEASILSARGDAILGSLPGRGMASIDGTAPVTDAGISSTLGRWGRKQSLDVVLAGGAAYGSNAVQSGVRPLARGRLGATLAWFGASVDSGHVVADRAGSDAGGNAVVARVRFGKADGLRLLGNVAARDGLDPVLARALTEAPLEPPAGFLVREGTTGGAGLVVPWGRALTTSIGADADATNQELVAARGGIELRDRCGCLTLRANGSHRIGRDGVDVWIAFDFAADR